MWGVLEVDAVLYHVQSLVEGRTRLVAKNYKDDEESCDQEVSHVNVPLAKTNSSYDRSCKEEQKSEHDSLEYPVVHSSSSLEKNQQMVRPMNTPQEKAADPQSMTNKSMLNSSPSSSQVIFVPLHES